ncbi:MAG: hypothetical protein COB41_06945 [Proteobacteria bacterium]|nr:MAG: hypothetical protein COB41_06945 [Pseudomonadota bacterium]
MKTFLKIAATSILIAFASVNAQAQDIKPYVGLGLGTFTTDFGSGFKSNSTFGGFLKGGLDFNPYIGAELRVGGIKSSTVKDAAGASSKATFISYLAKPQFPISDQATVYGLIGATTAKITVVSTGNPTTSKTKTQISFGAGFEYKVQDAVSVGVEYVQYSNKTDSTANFKAKITGISVTANYHF